MRTHRKAAPQASGSFEKYEPTMSDCPAPAATRSIIARLQELVVLAGDTEERIGQVCRLINDPADGPGMDKDDPREMPGDLEGLVSLLHSKILNARECAGHTISLLVGDVDRP